MQREHVSVGRQLHLVPRHISAGRECYMHLVGIVTKVGDSYADVLIITSGEFHGKVLQVSYQNLAVNDPELPHEGRPSQGPLPGAGKPLPKSQQYQEVPLW